MSAENFTILQFLSSATGFLVFLTVFGCENTRIRTQIVHLPMREEFKDTIFVKKILWEKFLKNDKTNLVFPLKTGKIPSDMKKGCISLIYKIGPKNKIGNYRPISLFNTDFKIFTKILTQRIRHSLGDLVQK